MESLSETGSHEVFTQSGEHKETGWIIATVSKLDFLHLEILPSLKPDAIQVVNKSFCPWPLRTW